MTRPGDGLALAVLPILAASSEATPEGYRDARRLADGLDPDTARALVALLCASLADLGRQTGEGPDVVRPYAQAALLALQTGRPLPPPP